MRQKTIKVGIDKIVLKARPVTSLKNLVGYRVVVNETSSYFWGVLTYKEAFDKSFARYINGNGNKNTGRIR